MPKFRQTADILKLMGKKELIRNLGIIAHIDHGKTTLTDSLLAGAGLLSSKVAGSARVLDYLEEEQKRGITMKTANISLLYQTANGSFVINLVDTPGHVDFTGKVTRALRAIDGAIVVVDAVEEIMVQTEIVTRQALEERVRPVLFINKVDRLITELKLNAEQIQKKFTRIIGNFNDLIEVYGESPFKDEWKVNPAKDSVVFGSALHRWGFTLSTAQQKSIRFSDVIEAYKNAEYEKLQKTIPLQDAILDMVVKNIPSPLEAQQYRVEKIWKGSIASEVGQAMVHCDDNGAAVMCITNVQADPNAGMIATGRLFSGTVKNGDKVYLVNARMESVVQQVSIFMGAFREPANQVVAGSLAALSGLELAKAGETMVDAEHKEGMVPFERIKYVSEPVVTVAVEPKNPRDLPFLLEAMDKLATEDPNLAAEVNRETGEYLLSGIGELHLEVALKLLREYASGMEITTSSPRVVYREGVTRKGIVAAARSPNKQNKFVAQVEPLREPFIRLIEQSATARNAGNVLAVDEQHKNVMVDCTGKTEQTREIVDFLTSGFEYACRAGPLCGEPLRHVRVNLAEIQLSENAEYCNPVEITHGVGKAIFGSFLTAKPVLLEPVYKTVISVLTEFAGECSRIISSRRGKLSAFEQKGTLTVITGYVPVAETFGLSEELRSATSGRAFWQSVFDRWEKVPEKLAAKVIKEVRKRKGLPSEVPKSERFLEET
ncbi:MAG TPA: elongation factor EF-2 [Candidatus Bathyarchaeia archaeon]|nr:elongation factor EF-2 [Candidatus Bathyarchaeia archaeon]